MKFNEIIKYVSVNEKCKELCMKKKFHNNYDVIILEMRS
jgi:hypothetical protein